MPQGRKVITMKANRELYKDICKHNTEVAKKMKTQAFEMLKKVQNGEIEDMKDAMWVSMVATMLSDYADELKWIGTAE